MNEFKKTFTHKGISGIVFDLDGTLINTYATMLEVQKENSEAIVKYLKEKHDYDINIEKFFSIYNQAEIEQYKAGNVSSILRFPNVVKRIFESLDIFLNPTELVDIFLPAVARLYNMTPEPFEGALETLHRFRFTKIVICTHSGREWAILKTDYLNRLYEEKYNEHLKFDLHYIPLDEPKDAPDWIIAYQIINEDPQNLIAVGDSFNSDILPAAEAKYKNLVWITKDGKDREQDLNELQKLGHNTLIIDHIKNLNHTTLSQLFLDT